MVRYQRALLRLLLLSAVVGVNVADADTIYLKDGTTQESDRIWQSQHHIHFILKGTTGVEIRYAKEIVARIEINGVVETLGPEKNDGDTKPPSPSPSHKSKHPPGGLESSSSNNEKVRVNSTPVDLQIVQVNKGLSFYDPRRSQRYWAARNSKHDTLNQALRALAKIYDRSIPWVESHMGSENDLGLIHQNLIEHQGMPAAAPTNPQSTPPKADELFYNRGKEYPYRIGPDKVFKTQVEAVRALAKQYGRSPQWVHDHFGMDNDLETIHANLKKAATKPEVTMVKKQEAKAIAEGATRKNGLQFYNPRRKEKYWTAKDRRFNSLKEAIQALSVQYGVSIEWVEKHMGNTNDLNEIHKNMQEGIK